MNKNKIMDKLKEGISVHEVESFARKHTSEVFTLVALVVGSVSSIFDFFTGPSMTILFLAAGFAAGMLFTEQMDRGLKQLFHFTEKQEKTTRMIIGGVKIVVGIFIPFVLFGVYGLLGGSSYNYFSRHAGSVGSDKSFKSQKGSSSDEHD